MSDNLLFPFLEISLIGQPIARSLTYQMTILYIASDIKKKIKENKNVLLLMLLTELCKQ